MKMDSNDEIEIKCDFLFDICIFCQIFFCKIIKIKNKHCLKKNRFQSSSKHKFHHQANTGFHH